MKKRVMLTLETANYEELQELVKMLELSTGTIGSICDDAIAEALELFRKAKEKGVVVPDARTAIKQRLIELGDNAEPATERTVKVSAPRVVGKKVGWPKGRPRGPRKPKMTA